MFEQSHMYKVAHPVRYLCLERMLFPRVRLSQSIYKQGLNQCLNMTMIGYKSHIIHKEELRALKRDTPCPVISIALDVLLVHYDHIKGTSV